MSKEYGRFLYWLRQIGTFDAKSLFPPVKKLSQEIKGKLGSLATGFFTTRSDMEGDGIIPGRSGAGQEISSGA